MNFKRELNLAQHIQQVENSQGWKETCKILDYITGVLWLDVLKTGVFFLSFLYLLLWLLFHPAPQVSLFLQSPLTIQLLVCKNSVVSQQITHFKVLLSNFLNLVLDKSQKFSVSRGKVGISAAADSCQLLDPKILLVPLLLFYLLLLLVLTGSPEKLCWDSVIFLESFNF